MRSGAVVNSAHSIVPEGPADPVYPRQFRTRLQPVAELGRFATRAHPILRLAVRRLLGMGLGGVFGMLGGMQMVPVRNMRVVRRLFVVLLLMMLGGGAMMFCRLLMMLCGLLVMLGNFRCIHGEFLRWSGPSARASRGHRRDDGLMIDR